MGRGTCPRVGISPKPAPDTRPESPKALGTTPHPTQPRNTGPVLLDPGAVIGGKYEIERVLGIGGHGVVYAARDLEESLDVAIKLLSHPTGRIPAAISRLRLEREAEILQKIAHPNVVHVHAIGWLDEDRPFLVMERLHGRSVHDDLVEHGVMDPPEAFALVQPVMDALSLAHAHGIVHRDLKPANLFLEEDGTAKLLDFGVSTVEARDDRLTHPGDVLGTPAYLAPEQLTPHVRIDGRTDVYGMGVTLYEMITGRLPFEESAALLFESILFDPPVPPSVYRPGLGADIDAILLRAMSKSPERRFETMKAFSDALEASTFTEERPRKSDIRALGAGERERRRVRAATGATHSSD